MEEVGKGLGDEAGSSRRGSGLREGLGVGRVWGWSGAQETLAAATKMSL